MSDDSSQAGAASSGDAGFSQADIDALMSGGAASSKATPPEDKGAASQVESGAVSQDDIDALLSAGVEGDAVESGDAGETETPPAEHSGAVSQDDIDALLSGMESGSEASSEDSGAGENASEAPPDDRVDSMGRPFDEAAAMMQAAIEEEKAAVANAPAPPPAAPIPPPPPGSAPPSLTNFDATIASADANRVSMLNDVKLRVKIELGRTRMLVEDVLQLGEGAVVELDKLAGDPVDVYVNDRLVARGEVLVLNDNFCVRISDVISNDPHRVSA